VPGKECPIKIPPMQNRLYRRNPARAKMATAADSRREPGSKPVN